MNTICKGKSLSQKHRQRGSTAVEFALVAAFGGFMVALFAALEVARILFMMNSANEATELGARVAIVCDKNSGLILERMQDIVPTLTEDDIQVDYEPAGCVAGDDDTLPTCKSVTVSIKPGFKLTATIPFVDFAFDMPAFTTTKPREAMDSTTCA